MRALRAAPVHLGCAGAGLAMAALFGGRAAPVVGLVTVAVLEWAARRYEPAARRRERRQAGADLPVAADLLAAALRAGAPPEGTVRTVGAALGGAVGRRLVACADALRDGVEPAVAWRALDELPGARRIVRAAVRSVDSGAALAGALTRVADDLRAERTSEAEARVRRAGVLVVLPLGLCFLPAFLLAGVVPVVVAVLGDVLDTR